MVKLLLTKKHFEITSLQTDDSALLHQIHQNCFIPAWEEQTFDTFLKDNSIFGYKVCLINQPDQILGFCLCRLILDEAEIITIAVQPHYRKQGIGCLLIDSILCYLQHARATKLFLEVEETNLSALALYQYFEFKKIAKRLAYYQLPNGRKNAIIMQKTFKQTD
ncbi:ribosomal protein S18-alanine N-acetyltransferase [Bartonella bovis]|uniref:Ribosomal-protein-alanine N-acetyltransferase n=1 Tax=Bartonella bovis m02 TaxID=1094492 RepID=N6UVW9_9HYPH|nr:ribosomal protein S18-alanine N-acetyltransferase [Bartonella bovis]ENN94208.1 ribosomal-protein-alanine N-acetyltransferase [Bartonella bovis m02]